MSENTASPAPVNGAECDICWGAKKLAASINTSPRKLYHMVQTGQIKSVKKVGKKLVGSPSAMRRELGA